MNADQVRTDVQRMAGDHGLMLGEGANGVIVVGLRANAEAIAREIVDKYGNAVEVTVGMFPYPPPETAPRGCQTGPVIADHRPLATVLAAQATVRGGEFFTGTLRITNAGAAPFELDTSGGFSVFLFQAGEAVPIGIGEGAIAGVGFGKTLAPGEAVELPAGGGTASCDLGLGYVLPAGVYQARALVDYRDPVAIEARAFWSDPTTIQVVDP
jgi:hypothetical protein